MPHRPTDQPLIWFRHFLRMHALRLFFDADRDVRVASDQTGRLSLRLDDMLRVYGLAPL